MSEAETTGDQRTTIDEDACLALTGDAEQCGNGLDTAASEPEAGYCGVHAGSDRPTVLELGGPAYAGLLEDLVDLCRSEKNAYALATISPDINEVWDVLTSMAPVQIGEVEWDAADLCYRAREVADHPDLEADDHPLAYPECIALQGRSAKNHSCPNSAYGTGLLCGMHKDADIPGTILDEGEPGPDLDAVTVDGDDYLLVEQRGEDLIVVDEDSYELKRLAGAAGAETRWEDPETTPQLSDDAETLVLVGCGDQKADEPRPAKDLYTSNYFQLKRRYAEEYGDEWAILSAKYGLLDPDAEVAPYDVTADDVHIGNWGVAVAGDLPDVQDTRVVVLAGPDYAEEVAGTAFMYGAETETPTEGMKIGDRMSWLSDQLDAGDEPSGDDVDEAAADAGAAPGPVEPEAPDSLPKYLRNGVQKQSAGVLRDLASYAQRMAEYREAEAERELEERADQDVDDTPDEWDDDEWEEVVDDARDDADIPESKGTLTTKEIDGRGYYYLQWRDKDDIKSKYVAPVTPADS